MNDPIYEGEHLLSPEEVDTILDERLRQLEKNPDATLSREEVFRQLLKQT